MMRRKKWWVCALIALSFLSLSSASDWTFAANSGKSRHGFSENDINLLARTVYGEARGEPYVGQVAVAAVILNRLESEKFPHTLSGIIFQPGAFTCVADGQIWLTPDKTARKAAIDAINGWDPTHGCIYYFNPATATSKWIWSRPQVKRIGKHIFCK
jgi:N-acetylmuramoyl-L-alanine amidase